MYSKMYSQASKAVTNLTSKLCCCFKIFIPKFRNSIVAKNESISDNVSKSKSNIGSFNTPISKQIGDLDRQELNNISLRKRPGKISDTLSNIRKIDDMSILQVNDNNTVNSPIRRGSKITKKVHKSIDMNPETLHNLIPIVGTSLFIFSELSRFRKRVWLIVTRSVSYDYFNMICIVLSLLVIAIDNSFLQDQSMIEILFYTDCVTSFTFIIDFFLKIISFGLIINGPYSYLRNTLNVLDAGSLVVSVIYIIANSYTVFPHESATTGGIENFQNNINSSASDLLIPVEEESQNKAGGNKILQIIKILRLLRLMKLIEHSKFLQAALRTLIKSLKQTFVIIFIGSCFILMFSVFGITYFRGLFYRCDFNNIPIQFMYEIYSKWDCLDYGGVWINPYPNFDNVKNSFTLLFEMMTTENWVFFMHLGIDSNALDYQPIKDNRYLFVIFFIIYMIFAYFFMLNLSISILFDNFKQEKEELQSSFFKLPLQKEFYKIYTRLYALVIPQKKKKPNKLTKVLLNILDSIYFDVVITVCIIGNLVILMMNTPGMDYKTLGFISYMNNIFNWIFICEAVLKIYVYRCEYFLNGWNLIDFLIVTDNLVNLLLKSFIDLFSRVFDTSILRAIRVARILRILKKAKTLNKIFNLFLNSIQPMISIGILYFILLFFYAIIGMSVFPYVKYQTIISEKWNFENFQNAFLLLIRITSGESWNIIMNECSRVRNLEYFCKYYDEFNQDELKSKYIIDTFFYYVKYSFLFNYIQI